MATASMADTLRKSKFFLNVQGDGLDELASLGRLVKFPARAKIFEEFQPAKDVYVLVSGEVSLAICEPADVCRQIAVVREGDLLGWSPLVGRTRLYDTAYAITPVEALQFDGRELMSFCAANPTLGFEFMRRVAVVLAERLSATRMQLMQISGIILPMIQPESD